jgi:hypothetical protein
MTDYNIDSSINLNPDNTDIRWVGNDVLSVE